MIYFLHINFDITIQNAPWEFCLCTSRPHGGYQLFLYSLKAENNKCSCGVLRLRTRLQGVNCAYLFVNIWSPISKMMGEVPAEDTPMLKSVFNYQSLTVWIGMEKRTFLSSFVHYLY